VATDISDVAAQVAARNCEKLGVTTQVTLLQGDTLEPVRNSGRRFDGLVSNPPYIRDDERESLQPEVAIHEPGTALFAGADGLDVVRRIIAQAPAVLKPGAFLSMELDPAQCETVGGMLEAAGFESVVIRRDLCGNERVVTGMFAAPS
jgi:release factor glutamine methyltransferase